MKPKKGEADDQITMTGAGLEEVMEEIIRQADSCAPGDVIPR